MATARKINARADSTARPVERSRTRQFEGPPLVEGRNRIPYGGRAGPQNQLGAFGLRIAYDTYRTELTSDATAVHGGNGGESVCGGYGHMPHGIRLPLATASRTPSMVEFGPRR